MTESKIRISRKRLSKRLRRIKSPRILLKILLITIDLTKKTDFLSFKD